METTAHRLITPMMVLNMLVMCALLVDISLARHQSSWLPITSSSQHVRNRNHAAALTSSRILQNNVIQKHLNDGDDSLQLSERSGLKSINRQRHAILAAACNVAIGCRGGGDCSSTDVIVEDTISVSVPLQNSNVDRINTPRNLSTEAILLSIRGGEAAVSDHDNNVIQSIIKSILDFPSLPSPIKNIIELICQFLESISGFKIMPNKEVMTKKKKKQSSKAKKKKSTGAKQQQSRKKVLVEEVSVGVASTTKKKKKRRAKQEDVKKMTSVAQKKKVDEEESESSDDEEEEEQSTVKEKASATLPTTTTTTSKPKPNKSKPDAASQKFLSNNLKSSNPNYRIQRELKEFIKSPPPGLSVKISGKNVRLWIVTLTMPENTSIYAGEKYKLRIQFPNDYPTSPPSVYFLPPTPRHEHVYTNGDICLSLLGKDWRPIMTASSIAGSIMSILCGAQRKSLPMDNARHASNKPGKKQDDWVYHDDNC